MWDIIRTFNDYRAKSGVLKLQIMRPLNPVNSSEILLMMIRKAVSSIPLQFLFLF